MMSASTTESTTGSEDRTCRAATASVGRLKVGMPMVTRGSGAGIVSPAWRVTFSPVAGSVTTLSATSVCSAASFVAYQPAAWTVVSDSQVRSNQIQPPSSKGARETVNSATPWPLSSVSTTPPVTAMREPSILER